jgi:hypothetical protein
MMTADELHQLGIKVVYKEMIDNGFEVVGVRNELSSNPQIVAKKDGKFVLVVVKTAAYPDMGVLYPRVAAEVNDIASQKGAICYFASVGVANANGETKEEMAKPTLNGKHLIKYEGLQPFPVF